MNKPYSKPVYVYDEFGQKHNTSFIFCIKKALFWKRDDHTYEYKFWAIHKKYKSLGAMVRAYVQLQINKSKKGMYKGASQFRHPTTGKVIRDEHEYIFKCSRLYYDKFTRHTPKT